MSDIMVIFGDCPHLHPASASRSARPDHLLSSLNPGATRNTPGFRDCPMDGSRWPKRKANRQNARIRLLSPAPCEATNGTSRPVFLLPCSETLDWQAAPGRHHTFRQPVFGMSSCSLLPKRRSDLTVNLVMRADVVKDYFMFGNLHAQDNAVGVVDANRLFPRKSACQRMQPQRRRKRILPKCVQGRLGRIPQFWMSLGETLESTGEIRRLL